jgi:hypothetical protein
MFEHDDLCKELGLADLLCWGECTDPEPYVSENGERSEYLAAPDDGPSKWFEPRTFAERAGVL